MRNYTTYSDNPVELLEAYLSNEKAELNKYTQREEYNLTYANQWREKCVELYDIVSLLKEYGDLSMWHAINMKIETMRQQDRSLHGVHISLPLRLNADPSHYGMLNFSKSN